MENQQDNPVENYPLIPEEAQFPQPLKPQGPNYFQHVRSYLTGALAAASILTAAPGALADDAKQDTKNVGPRVARIGSRPPLTDSGVKKESDGSKPHESHLKHNTLKLGSIMAVGPHPTFGTEVTWSYMPNIDETKKLHFTITPVDFFVAQHHTEYKIGHEEGVKTSPKYFIGSLVGMTYIFNKHLELEVEAGGGMAAIPSYSLINKELSGMKYEFAPVIKADLQLDIVFNDHFRTYIAYSPELIPKPITHAVTEEGVERKPHLAHIIAVGVGTEF